MISDLSLWSNPIYSTCYSQLIFKHSFRGIQINYAEDWSTFIIAPTSAHFPQEIEISWLSEFCCPLPQHVMLAVHDSCMTHAAWVLFQYAFIITRIGAAGLGVALYTSQNCLAIPDISITSILLKITLRVEFEQCFCTVQFNMTTIIVPLHIKSAIRQKDIAKSF